MEWFISFLTSFQEIYPLANSSVEGSVNLVKSFQIVWDKKCAAIFLFVIIGAEFFHQIERILTSLDWSNNEIVDHRCLFVLPSSTIYAIERAIIAKISDR